ncbi:uracil-DNA glycosylase [Psychrobacillus psychrodurans]|uniref:uracil-DNA glycosylase n=1 Tax=Psychrobacillus psychrodurans TaxID=126157 RepID=UPI0008E2F424|nr:uracil-DNA glycosylase [Psychrobacillus psychrodurans]MCZ8538920.1 uracil-DNA glycosylase [Psychrobacillus psychrodurans]SFM24929.1 uracil-DNA glycosylase [Psychrobacillus psychrodurans]
MPSWKDVLREEQEKPYYKKLQLFLDKEYATQTIFPARNEIGSAFKITAYDNVKVVILGQDPYHGNGQAHGMSFSVKPGVRIPPSLRNMLKELEDDLGCPFPTNGYLEKWAKQGVLLLNTVLTVRTGAANSHKGMGWETYTDAVIQKLSDRQKPIIFVLWGKPAQSKIKLIDTEKHIIITAPHPSPLSAHRGFFGSKPYSRINVQLAAWGEQPIDFCL